MTADEKRKLAKELRCGMAAINRHLRRGDLDDFITERKWRMENDVPLQSRIYKRDGRFVLARDVIEECEVSFKTANARCNRWERGEISWEELWKPNPQAWRHRQQFDPIAEEARLLAKIPGPTEYEKAHPELWS